MHYLLDEKLLFGNLRTETGMIYYGYQMLVDTFQALRPLMSVPQTLPYLRKFGELVSDPSLPQGILSTISKLLVNTFELLNTRLRGGEVLTPEVTLRTNVTMHALMETLCTRVQTSVTNANRLAALRNGTATDEIKQWATLEQSRTVPVIYYLASDNYEGCLNGK